MPFLRAPPRALFRLPLTRAPIRFVQNSSSNPSSPSNPTTPTSTSTTNPANTANHVNLPKPPHKDIHSDPYDNTSVHRDTSENTSSGTDSGVADDCLVSFDPKSTRPEQELEEAGWGFDVS